jgi:uncharacterized protein YhfF
MLPRSAETDAFWQAFRRHLGLDHDNYVVGSFGDTPEMATELADLVFAEIKRATASLVRDYSEGREPTPKPGDFVMMLDGEGHPRFIWRTTEATIKPLSRVDDAFALDEGERDRRRAWRLDPFWNLDDGPIRQVSEFAAPESLRGQAELIPSQLFHPALFRCILAKSPTICPRESGPRGGRGVGRAYLRDGHPPKRMPPRSEVRHPR